MDESFPVDFANRLASKERYNKHLYRPNTYLHKWWARRCGTTFRLILKSLVEDETKRDYYSPGGLENKIILDPMMGGCTTLHEAIRLNANVIGVDIDPIPYLQAYATLSKYDLFSIKTEFNKMIKQIRNKCIYLYKTKCPLCNSDSEFKYLLLGLRKRCQCRDVISIDSYILRQEKDKNIIICPLCGLVHTDKIEHKCTSGTILFIEKKEKKCSLCDSDFKEFLEVPFRERYTPFCVFGHCDDHGDFFKKTDSFDIANIEKAKKKYLDGPFNPNFFMISEGPKSKDLLHRNIHTYLELFSYRQLNILKEFHQYLNTIQSNDLKILFTMLLSTSLEFNSIMCGYKGASKRRPGAIRHVFSHHAYSFPHIAVENNPIFYKESSGNLKSLFKLRIEKAKKWAEHPIERKIDSKEIIRINGEKDYGEFINDFNDFKNRSGFYILTRDSSELPLKDNCIDFIITDPPYYDSVQYSNLSEFFRIWLMKMLPDIIEWNVDLKNAAVSPDSGPKNNHYRNMMKSIFLEMRRIIKKSYGRFIFTFHHWDPKAWTDITIALINSDFFLCNYYTVISENPISVHIKGINSLEHDNILVFSPNRTDSKSWEKVDSIDNTNSKSFCSSCGQLLGWILNTQLLDEEIYNIWKQAMKNGNELAAETLNNPRIIDAGK
jgi:putative DNA methylase